MSVAEDFSGVPGIEAVKSVIGALIDEAGADLTVEGVLDEFQEPNPRKSNLIKIFSTLLPGEPYDEKHLRDCIRLLEYKCAHCCLITFLNKYAKESLMHIVCSCEQNRGTTRGNSPELDSESETETGTEWEMGTESSHTSGDEEDKEKTHVLREVHYCNSGPGKRVRGCKKEDTHIVVSAQGSETNSNRTKFENLMINDGFGGIEHQTSFVKTIERIVVQNSSRSRRDTWQRSPGLRVRRRAEQSSDVEVQQLDSSRSSSAHPAYMCSGSHDGIQPVVISLLTEQQSNEISHASSSASVDGPIVQSPSSRSSSVSRGSQISMKTNTGTSSKSPKATAASSSIAVEPISATQSKRNTPSGAALLTQRIGSDEKATLLTINVATEDAQKSILKSAEIQQHRVHPTESPLVDRKAEKQGSDNHLPQNNDGCNVLQPSPLNQLNGHAPEDGPAFHKTGIFKAENVVGADIAGFISNESQLRSVTHEQSRYAAPPKISMKSVSFVVLEPPGSEIDKMAGNTTEACESELSTHLLLPPTNLGEGGSDSTLSAFPSTSAAAKARREQRAILKKEKGAQSGALKIDQNSLHNFDEDQRKQTLEESAHEPTQGINLKTHDSKNEYVVSTERFPQPEYGVTCLSHQGADVVESGSSMHGQHGSNEDNGFNDEATQIDFTAQKNNKMQERKPRISMYNYRNSANNYYLSRRMICVDMDPCASVENPFDGNDIEEDVTSLAYGKRDLAGLPLKQQESIILSDVCLLLEAYDGYHVCFATDASDGPTYRNRFGEFSLDQKLAPPLKAIVVSLLPVISCHGYLLCFLNAHVTTNGKSMLQTFAKMLGVFLANYYSFLSRVKADVKNIYELYDRMHPWIEIMKVWAHTAADIEMNKLRGGAMLDYLLEGNHQIVKDMVSRVAAPFLQLLAYWLQHGVIRDPYGDFFIMDLDSLGENLNTMGSTANYWNNRFVVKTELLPGFLNNEVHQIVAAGKFINIVHQCSCKIFPIQKLELVISGSCPNIRPQLEKAYYAAAQNIYEVLVSEYDLLGHFDFVQEFLLWQNNDIVATFLDLARDLLKEPAMSGNENQFHEILWYHLKQSAHKENPKIVYLRCLLLPMTIKDQIASLVSTEPSWSAMCGQCFQCLTLSYDTPWPISLVFNSDVTIKLQMLWRQVFQFYFIECELRRVCGREETAPKKFPGRSDHQNIFTLRERMIRLMQNLQIYMTIKVIRKEWDAFRKGVQAVRTADTLFDLLQNFLNTALYNCMAVGTETLCDTLCKLCAVCLECVQAKDEIGSIRPAASLICKYNQLEAAFFTYVRGAAREFPHAYFQTLIDIQTPCDKNQSKSHEHHIEK